MNTKDEFEGLVRDMHRIAIENFNRDGHVCPVVWIFPTVAELGPTCMMVGELINDKGEKTMLAEVLRTCSSMARCIVFISECWVVDLEKADEVTKKLFEKRQLVAEQSPARIEGIQAVIYCRFGNFSILSPFTRDEDDKAVWRNDRVHRWVEADGIFADIFPVTDDG